MPAGGSHGTRGRGDIGRTGSGADRIATGEDVARLIVDIRDRGLERAGTSALARVLDRVDDVGLPSPDARRVLPVAAQLQPLFPWPGGIRRGALIAAIGSTSLLLSLIASASATGSWSAVAGMPQLGLLAAAEYGVDLARLALVPAPGPDWPSVVAALIDGFDLVVVETAGHVEGGLVQRLAARARQRGTVLITTAAWPGCDVTIDLVDRRWEGLGDGHGRLRRQTVTLRVVGRGRAVRPRQIQIAMPPSSDKPGLERPTLTLIGR